MSDTDEMDWLAIPQPRTVAQLRARPEYQRAVDTLRKLTAKQRLYLDCLFDSELDSRAARRLLKERSGISITRRTTDRWEYGDPDFAEALSATQGFMLAASGLSKAALLAKLAKLADDCRALTPYTDKQGNSFQRPIDASAAHATLMTMAKLTGALQEASERAPPDRILPTITVQILAPPGTSARMPDVIDGELISKDSQ